MSWWNMSVWFRVCEFCERVDELNRGFSEVSLDICVSFWGLMGQQSMNICSEITKYSKTYAPQGIVIEKITP